MLHLKTVVYIWEFIMHSCVLTFIYYFIIPERIHKYKCFFVFSGCNGVFWAGMGADQRYQGHALVSWAFNDNHCINPQWTVQTVFFLFAGGPSLGWQTSGFMIKSHSKNVLSVSKQSDFTVFATLLLTRCSYCVYLSWLPSLNESCLFCSF